LQVCSSPFAIFTLSPLTFSSDRYKVFIDLFNLASFLIPREFLPKLSTEMKWRLAVADVQGSSQEDGQEDTGTHRISGKTNGKKAEKEEEGLMAHDAFHPVND
jgi:hypothetical protein